MDRRIMYRVEELLEMLDDTYVLAKNVQSFKKKEFMEKLYAIFLLDDEIEGLKEESREEMRLYDQQRDSTEIIYD